MKTDPPEDTTRVQEKELLPCPFCDAQMEPKTDKYKFPWTSHPYNNCILQGMWFTVVMWNQRAAAPPESDSASVKSENNLSGDITSVFGDAAQNLSVVPEKPWTKSVWHIGTHDAGCVMDDNNNVIGLAQDAKNANRFVKEHNGTLLLGG